MKPILSTLRLCGLSVAILLLFATVAPAAAQQVRTVGETLVHLDPDPESPTIATLPAGTDLTWVGESGEWYTVSFTGPAGDDLLGYVRAGEVQVMGAPSAPPAAPGAGGPPLMGGGGVATPFGQIPDAQIQYENERSRRSSGVKKIIWGAVLIMGSRTAINSIPGLKQPTPDDYATADEYQSALDRRETAETAQGVVSGLGGALAAWGAVQVGFGWYRMSRLSVDLPRAAEASLEEQYADALDLRSSGRTKLGWGIFLTGASYAALEWIPQLQVSDPSEYDNADDYQSAIDRRDAAQNVGTWFTVTGSALGAWGIAQWVIGARRMSRIEATARMATLDRVPGTPADHPLAPELFVGKDRRGRTELGLQWAW